MKPFLGVASKVKPSLQIVAKEKPSLGHNKCQAESGNNSMSVYPETLPPRFVPQTPPWSFREIPHHSSHFEVTKMANNSLPEYPKNPGGVIVRKPINVIYHCIKFPKTNPQSLEKPPKSYECYTSSCKI